MSRKKSGLPKYVKAVRRGRKTHVYFRHGGKYLRLPADTSSPEFHRAYAEALAGTQIQSSKALPPGTTAAMIADYKRSPEYTGLAVKTQTDYARQLDHLGKAVGPYPAKDIRRANIVKLRNKLATKGNRTADLFISVVCRAFRVGMDLGYVDQNPAADISRINKAQSFKAWPKSARDTFEASSPPEALLVAHMLGLYTSLRLGDVLRLTWANYQDGCFVTRHTKSMELAGLTDGEDYIPAARPLRELLERLPKTSMMIVARADGRKWNERHFSAVFRDHLDAIGLDHLHFHGLRKTTAKALAEAGATSKEIAAITGHRTLSMVELYTEQAEQKKLAKSVISKLDRAKQK
ncbi:MAG: hypothetical protein B7Y80_19605 [Hyphomicrobium sp. 32-62-53]|nr:MAG: hypothetical protein B7Z29_19805 [Hyphomicrobium sp. 12-62-95]OYX97470.1 MAG: hypothetical protein B7Y80_19605 [Hyphomicrobium sp. 32-62-53]